MTENITKDRLKDIPAGRAGKLEAVAFLALFLASDDSDSMNEAAVFIDGAWTVGR